MSNDLFNPNNATPQAEFDPVREAMNKANLSGGGRDKYLKKGTGIYAIERLMWGASPKNGSLRLTFVVKCESHETDGSLVGKTFEHRIDYAKPSRPLPMTLAEYARWLVFPFGAAAKALIETDAIKTLVVNAYKEQFRTIVQNQELAPGGDYKYAGKRVKLEVVDRPYVDKATGENKMATNVHIDVAA